MKTYVKLSNFLLSLAIIFAVGLAIYLQMQFSQINKQIYSLSESLATTNILLSEGLLEPASGEPEPDVQSGVVLYKMLENVNPNQLKSLNGLLKGQGLLKEMPMGPSGVTMARFDGSSHGREKAISKMLQKSGLVEFAEPDYKVDLTVDANDPDYTSQWHHKTVKTPQAWDITTGSNSVLVAVCDTGVDTNHPDLIDNLRLDLAWNAHEDSTYVTDTNGHGTGTIGVLGAVGDNATGVTGINWNVDIIPIRIAISDTNSGAYTSTMAKCIEYAANQGAKIVNLSYTGVYSSTVDSAAKYLRDKGGLLFMAAANNGEEQTWPDFPSSIAVAATDQNNNRASFSNWGEFVDITAPGVSIRTTYKNKSYTSYSGTSFSSPLVAGIGALMISANPNITADQIENGLFSTAVNIGDAYLFGSGLANAEAAIQYALNLAGDAPKAELYVSTETAQYNEEISFSAANSFDNDGKIVSYQWEFADGDTASQPEVIHAYSKAGAYTVTLKVTDNDGLINTAQTIIQVTNDIPVIEKLTADIIEGDVPLVVNFQQTSTDADGEIVSYAWDFGDGNQSTEENPSHTYESQGSFEARLTVTDNAGGQNSKALTITVKDPNYVPLEAPTNLSGYNNGNNTFISWSDNSNEETGFIIKRTVISTGWSTEYKVPANTSSFEEYILKSNEQRYEVRAYNNNETSNAASLDIFVDVNADDTPLEEASLLKPSNLKASNTGHDVTLTWSDNSNNETGFIIKRTVIATGWNTEYKVPANTTSFEEYIKYSNEQRYEVISFNENETSEPVILDFNVDVNSSSSSADTAKLIAPTNISVTSSGHDVTITWADNSENELGFIIKRTVIPTGWSTEYKVPANTTSLEEYITYSNDQRYEIVAYNDIEKTSPAVLEIFIDVNK